MEAHIAVLRPRYRGENMSSLKTSILSKYDLILVDPRPSEKTKHRQLLRLTPDPDEVLSKAVLSHVFLSTGGGTGGIIGERAVKITSNANVSMSTTYKDLFCVPVLHSSVLPMNLNGYAFYSLDTLQKSGTDSDAFLSPDSYVFIIKLIEWLTKVHNSSDLTTCLFRSKTKSRLRASINNPAFYNSQSNLVIQSPDVLNQSSEDRLNQSDQFAAHQVLAKMLFIEKCDKVVLNPLFGSGLPYTSKVNDAVVNKHWGKGVPDYSKVTLSSISHGSRALNWERDYPLHKCAYDGDVVGIKELLNQSYSPSKHDQDSWTPLHYAAWGSHQEAVGLLLDSGCPPNVVNNKGSTALHLAALCGHIAVINRLLQHPDIDSMGVDCEQKTALDLCQGVPRHDWQRCAFLLKAASEKLQVYLMDGSERKLNLLNGKNTTVQQLHSQMMKLLSLPEKCGRVFTIWLCSSSLELQLKAEHEPLQKIKEWQGTCVKLTDSNSNVEEPLLMWRRDALLTAVEENTVSHPVAVRLLFHEAYHNYIKALYPCSEKDVHMFAAILLYMTQGEFDQNKAKAFFADSNNLQTLVPFHKLKKSGTTGINKIFHQYKLFSTLVMDMDKSLQSLQLNFLRWCRNLTVYGSAFFNGSLALNHSDKMQKASKNQTLCLVAVNDIGVHLINAESRDMIQSFKYHDVRWQHIPERPILEIKSKASPRSTTFVRTKQAGLIDHLMTKMANISKDAS